VAAAFELSDLQLDTDAALLFRLLPVNPGPHVSTAAAGALANCPPARAVVGISSSSPPAAYRLAQFLILIARFAAIGA